jgi:hypothetical protein
MNIGFYINDLKDQDLVNKIITETQINKKYISSTSIFYDNVGPFPFGYEVALFNSTELWAFTGKLIVFSEDLWTKANNIINKFETYLYYDQDNVNNVLSLFKMIDSDCKVVPSSEESVKEFYRLTGCSALNQCENMAGIVKVLHDN